MYFNFIFTIIIDTTAKNANICMMHLKIENMHNICINICIKYTTFAKIIDGHGKTL